LCVFVTLQLENNHHEEDGDSKHQETSIPTTKQEEKKSKKGQQSPDGDKEEQKQKEEDEQESSDEEQEKIKNGTLSDHSSDEMEEPTEIMMKRSLSQEFTLINGKIAALQKLEKQHQEREKMLAMNDTQSNNTAASINSTDVKSQAHNQKVQQQQQQQVVQKTRPMTSAPNTTTTKPTEGQYTTMTSRRQQQQQVKDMERIDNGQKYHSGDHNTRPQPQQRPMMKDKDMMMGRDNRDTRYHYAPNPNRIKQLPPRFQRMAQEQLANQQQQQQQHVRTLDNFACNYLFFFSSHGLGTLPSQSTLNPFQLLLAPPTIHKPLHQGRNLLHTLPPIPLLWVSYCMVFGNCWGKIYYILLDSIENSFLTMSFLLCLDDVFMPKDDAVIVRILIHFEYCALTLFVFFSDF